MSIEEKVARHPPTETVSKFPFWKAFMPFADSSGRRASLPSAIIVSEFTSAASAFAWQKEWCRQVGSPASSDIGIDRRSSDVHFSQRESTRSAARANTGSSSTNASPSRSPSDVRLPQ